MPMYNSLEYSGDYAKTTGSLDHWGKGDSFYTAGGNFIVNMNNSALYRFKNEWTLKTAEEGSIKEATNDVPLK